MHHDPVLRISPTHPYAQAVASANAELATGARAAAEGNQGKVRVCARRAVGIFLQTIGPAAGGDYGPHAMANLRGIHDDASLPVSLRAAAERLLGGSRSILAGDVYSSDPIADAALIIEHFIRVAAPSAE